jgi:hypothetical protein
MGEKGKNVVEPAISLYIACETNEGINLNITINDEN